MRLASPMPEPRGEKYDWYFNQLTDELSRQAYPYAENWYRWRPGQIHAFIVLTALVILVAIVYGFLAAIIQTSQ